MIIDGRMKSSTLLGFGFRKSTKEKLSGYNIRTGWKWKKYLGSRDSNPFTCTIDLNCIESPTSQEDAPSLSYLVFIGASQEIRQAPGVIFVRCCRLEFG